MIKIRFDIIEDHYGQEGSKTIKGLDCNHEGAQNHRRAIMTKKGFEITKGPSQLGIENKKMRKGFEITKLRTSQQ